MRLVSDDERERLLAACRASKWKRLPSLMLLGVTTGARRSELMHLRWRDMDLDGAVAYIATTKNSEPEVLPLLPVVVQELQKFATKHGHVLVFASHVRPDVPYNFEGAWRLALKQARVPRFRFHDLRHTCASCLAQNGASLLEIADVMGHRQLAMVKRYAHLTVKSTARSIRMASSSGITTMRGARVLSQHRGLRQADSALPHAASWGPMSHSTRDQTPQANRSCSVVVALGIRRFWWART